MLVAHLQFLDQLELVELIISISITTAVKPRHRRHVETVESVKKPQRATNSALPPLHRFVGKTLKALNGDLFSLTGKSHAKHTLAVLI